MKRHSVFPLRKFSLFIMCVFSALMLLSCSNLSVFSLISTNYTESDANYALHKALDSALKMSVERLPQAFRNSDYIPEYYDILKDRSDIPGMNTLNDYATEYYAGFINENISFFKDNLAPLASAFAFSEPKKLVKESPSSASEVFLSLYKESIVAEYKKLFSQADKDYFDDIVSQYNAFVLTEMGLSTSETDVLEKRDISSYVAEVVCDLFFNLMIQNEEYYRTTPNAYTDKTVIRVFGV